MSLWLPDMGAIALDRELRQIDRHLFLAEHRDRLGRSFFEVRYHVGSAVEPLVVVDWRERDDTPKPLTSGLLHEVSRVMNSGPPDVGKIVKRNEELRKSHDEEHLELYEELAEDVSARARGTRGTIMPRSQNVAQNARRQRLRDVERRQGLR